MSVIHYFNPGHENAVLNKYPSYTPPASMASLMRELASLPAWYANSKDAILVGDEFNVEYHKFLINEGLYLPNLIFHSDLEDYNESKVCMWGISPLAIRVFENYNKLHSINLRYLEWNEKYFYFNSRIFARDVLIEIVESSDLFKTIKIPTIHYNLQSIDSYVDICLTRQLAKSPYSSSGRGLLWLPSDSLTRVERQILQGMLNKQGSVTIEPVYNKKIDFAMEFIVNEKREISFVGYSLFSTNEKGAYRGNYLQSQIDIVDKLSQFIELGELESTKALLKNILLTYLGSEYVGCIGVDMMVCKEKNSYVLHPCVEINMRYNMGYLAINLYDKFISCKSKGIYILDFDAHGKIYPSHQEMMKKYPLIIEEGRVQSGYLSLCPVHEKTKYRAYILIERL